MADYYTTGRMRSELVKRIPVNNGKKPIAVLSVGPLSLNKGDLVDIRAEVQFTNNLGGKPAHLRHLQNIMVVTFVAVAMSKEDGSSPASMEICERNGRNISVNMHHDVHVKTAIWRCDRDYVDIFINLNAYAGRTPESKETVPITVDQDYGHMDVLVHRMEG